MREKLILRCEIKNSHKQWKPGIRNYVTNYISFAKSKEEFLSHFWGEWPTSISCKTMKKKTNVEELLPPLPIEIVFLHTNRTPLANDC